MKTDDIENKLHEVLDEQLEPFCENLVPTDLQSKETMVAQFKARVHDAVQGVRERIAKGHEILSEAGAWPGSLGDTKLANLYEETTGHPELHSIFEVTHMSVDELLAMYDVGSRLYEEGKFEEAEAVLFTCCLINPNVSALWVSLGLTSEQLHKEEEAAHAYTSAAMLEESATRYYLNAAECFSKAHKPSLAHAVLEEATKTLTEHHSPENDALLREVQELRKKVA